ncbi:ABC transporter ATP-binding protein [Actinoplanes sp. LDG1-06]|uniref:ABC transporter ATP-binding protein n=2 Tax=Paractinoplanes ovalisporus TaxID=2810368 RepID=A0ABS2APS9_9ACTN|nr:ABC transporter ATP-binding protein [Actinoplanes ovalisporus]
MGLAGWFAVDGQLSIGRLIAAVGLTQALLPQIESIANLSIPNLAGARASSARILDVLRDNDSSTPAPDKTLPYEVTRDNDTSTPEPGKTLPYEVTRDNDTSTPEPGKTLPYEVTRPPVLEVSEPPVTVGPGELVGVRADDRTAARIAGALLDPWAGDDVHVRLDGVPVRELSPATYRSRVTVAPHRAMLFIGTIRDNVAGNPELTDTAVRAAACDDFATDLGVPVGEGGNRLSGGQRQRVALARALASDAPVLVLHDPTTAVDSVTEHAIAGRLRGVRAGRSTLLIASSPALLGCCDRVVDLLGEAAP